MNITLIGMTGAGKSHVGKMLAQRLSIKFVDIDAELEIMRGKPLERIREELDDDRFMRAEEEAIFSLTEGKDDLIISPGGSIAYEERAKRHLKDISRVVYLNVPFSVIQRRIGTSAVRLQRIVGLHGKTLEELYYERVPLYEQCADFTIDAEDRDAEDIIAEIVGHMSAGSPISRSAAICL